MQRRKRKNKSFFSLQTKNITKNFSRRFRSHRASSVMLIIGLCLILIGGLQSIQAYSNPTFEGEVSPVYSARGFYAPIELIIPSINIKHSIKKTFIVEGKWQVSEKEVSHLATSSNLDVEGNVILYGHNTYDMLDRLHNVKIGESIILKDSKGRSYEYIVTEIKVVEPTDIESLTSYEDQTLTIYTCTGFADLKRLLIKAKRLK